MKTVVITGSARGFGLELAKEFRKYNFNVVISDILDNELINAVNILKTISSNGNILTVKCDVTKEEDLINLKDETVNNFGSIDIWINNAGVNQKMIPIWEVDTRDINRLIDIDLKGAIVGSKIAINQMIKQGFGQIYGIEGYGSDDAMMTGLCTDGFQLPDKVKHVYNILGDKPDVIAKFMVQKIVNNNKNGVRFTWLTGRKAMWRFMTSGSRKNRFFN